MTPRGFQSRETGRMARNAAVTASARVVFAVLRAATAADAPLTIAELARRLGISLNKAYRAVVTLEEAGYLRRNGETGRFESGTVTERLVYAVIDQFRVRAAMAPFLRQIATSAEAMAFLAVRIGWFAVTLMTVESGGAIVSRHQRLGRATLLHRDPAGLVMLASMAPEEVARFAAFSATSRQESVADDIVPQRLASVRAAGFAVRRSANGQFQALAMPLLDHKGNPMASITIEASGGRTMPLERDPLLKEWLGMVAQAQVALRANPQNDFDPYAFIDPDQIRFAARLERNRFK